MNEELILRNIVITVFEDNPELWIILIGMAIMSYLLPVFKKKGR